MDLIYLKCYHYDTYVYYNNYSYNSFATHQTTPEKIKTVNPYYIKLLTTSEIQDKIASKPTNALLHFHVDPAENSGVGKCFEMIFDVEGNLYYCNSCKITNENGDGFNMNDFNINQVMEYNQFPIRLPNRDLMIKK